MSAFDAYNLNIHKKTEKSKQRIAHVGAKTSRKDSLTYAVLLQRALAQTIKELGITESLDLSFDRPDASPKGSTFTVIDFSYKTFALAKALGKSPVETASILSDKLTALLQAKDYDDLFSMETVGPYINFALKPKALYGVLTQILADKQLYGTTNKHHGEVAVVDYSSPNIAKPFGVNHLRSTVIGNALCNLLEAEGYTVIRDNHLGDWGTQFGNLLAAYEVFGDGRPFTELALTDLNKLYVQFSQEKKTDPELVRKGQLTFAKLQQGDEILLSRWKHAFDVSMKEFAEMYARLGIHFDTEIGEAFFSQAARSLAEKLAEDFPQLVKKDTDTGSIYINGVHPIPLVSSDGYELYAARDLATLDFRIRQFSPRLILYVVGEEQATSFDGLFAVAEAAGLDDCNGIRAALKHVGFGLLLDKEGKKLSTRKGTSGKLEDVINQVFEKAVQEIKKRDTTMSMQTDEVTEIAEQVAIGAIVWNDLKTDRRSSTKFDIDSMLKLEAGTVVDAMYAYSRARSILKKANLADMEIRPELITDPAEIRVLSLLADFPRVIAYASNELEPHHVVNYLQKVVRAHGAFYEKCRVIGEEDKRKQCNRAAIHEATSIVLSNGLRLLGIKHPERV